MTDDFDRSLNSLCAKEAAAGSGDADRLAGMVVALSSALGFAISHASGGKPEAIDEMVAGTEAFIHERAVSTARITRLVNKLKTQAPPFAPEPNREIGDV